MKGRTIKKGDNMLQNKKNLFAGLLIALAIILPANAMAKIGVNRGKPAPVRTNPAPVVRKTPVYKPAPVRTNSGTNRGSARKSNVNTKNGNPAPVRTKCVNCNKSNVNTKNGNPAPVRTKCVNCGARPTPVPQNPTPTPIKPTPVNKIKVCQLNGKNIVEINENDFNSSKYTKDLTVCKKQRNIQPEKKMEVCDLRSKKIVTINASQYGNVYTTDLQACAEKRNIKPEAVKDIEVCELSTKTIKTIKENQFDGAKYSKNKQDCNRTITPVPSQNPTKTITAEPSHLAQTGPTEVISSIIGLSALSASVYYYILSRKMN